LYARSAAHVKAIPIAVEAIREVEATREHHRRHRFGPHYPSVHDEAPEDLAIGELKINEITSVSVSAALTYDLSFLLRR